MIATDLSHCRTYKVLTDTASRECTVGTTRTGQMVACGASDGALTTQPAYAAQTDAIEAAVVPWRNLLKEPR